MGAPLYDITIYYHGQVIKDKPFEWDFHQTVNYIADCYHNRLNGYKPAKTARICIELSPTKTMDKPIYFGSICSYDNIIDEQAYLSLPKEGKYKYILDLLHSAVSEISAFYNWEQSIFNKAYDQIIESEFKFAKSYPEKKSRDRKHTGQIILTKTETISTLSILVTGDKLVKNKILLEKPNGYWYDTIYQIAKDSKWLDNSSFGFCKDGKNCYYSIDDDKIVNDLIFSDKIPF